RQWNIERNRVRGDQHVERTNEYATPMKRCSNLAVGAGRSEVEWQDRERLQGAFDGSAITFGSIECRPECKFGCCNGGNADIADRKSQEPLADVVVAMREYVGHDVRVEQDLHFFLSDRLRRGANNSSFD